VAHGLALDVAQLGDGLLVAVEVARETLGVTLDELNGDALDVGRTDVAHFESPCRGAVALAFRTHERRGPALPDARRESLPYLWLRLAEDGQPGPLGDNDRVAVGHLGRASALGVAAAEEVDRLVAAAIELH